MNSEPSSGQRRARDLRQQELVYVSAEGCVRHVYGEGGVWPW